MPACCSKNLLYRCSPREATARFRVHDTVRFNPYNRTAENRLWLIPRLSGGLAMVKSPNICCAKPDCISPPLRVATLPVIVHVIAPIPNVRAARKRTSRFAQKTRSRSLALSVPTTVARVMTVLRTCRIFQSPCFDRGYRDSRDQKRRHIFWPCPFPRPRPCAKGGGPKPQKNNRHAQSKSY